MSLAFLSLAPAFLLILMGWVIRSRAFLPDSFWEPAERMTYYVFFPALLAESTATASFGDLPVLGLAAALITGLVATAALVLILYPRFAANGPALTSIFQGAIRPNTYVAIAIVFALYGNPGVAILSVSLALVIPTVNLLSVIVLVRHAGGGVDSGWRAASGQIIRNPLILGVVLGGLLNASGIGLPPVFGSLLHVLGQAALPIGLLAVGAGLNFSATRRQAREIWLTTATKLVLLPALTGLACLAFGIDGLPLAVSVIYGTAPCSASSYVLARQMGGDAELMAGIITATTLAAMVAIPLALIVLATL